MLLYERGASCRILILKLNGCSLHTCFYIQLFTELQQTEQLHQELVFTHMEVQILKSVYLHGPLILQP